jgi:hypothetical protein
MNFTNKIAPRDLLGVQWHFVWWQTGHNSEGVPASGQVSIQHPLQLGRVARKAWQRLTGEIATETFRG